MLQLNGMDEKHELVSAVKALAVDLGHVPNKTQFEERVTNGWRKIQRTFGTYTLLLQAAGLETYNERRGVHRVTREALFGADIEQAVSDHKPRIVDSSPKDFKPILCLGDTHFPFAHQKTLERVYRFAEKEQPAYIVQLGDLQDQFAHSKFPASRNVYKPDEEMELGRKHAADFWKELQRACPHAKCYGLTGNHDTRILRTVLQNAPTLESLVRESLVKLYQFEGVESIHDYREELTIQGVMFHHGYMSRHGQQRDFVQQNVVHGHTHRGAVVYKPLKERSLWELDAGFLGDAEAKVVSYTPQKTTGWTLGWGWVDQYGPRFIPA